MYYHLLCRIGSIHIPNLIQPIYIYIYISEDLAEVNPTLPLIPHINP